MGSSEDMHGERHREHGAFVLRSASTAAEASAAAIIPWNSVIVHTPGSDAGVADTGPPPSPAQERYAYMYIGFRTVAHDPAAACAWVWVLCGASAHCLHVVQLRTAQHVAHD
jgi:hypothetical protein